MNRWKMNKLGFLNFWLYDQEEFSLHDGHILLRGSNAAGKSITTQSFIPFLLDGDKSPQRLDPFGSRERKMEFYLLGDNEREESTGYLYLEFRKPGMEEYRTIGVGMRAQKGKGIDFWGFCLCDGRRIGPGGLLLYEKMGRQNLPLSKQKLRGLIGSLDCWAESQVKYKEMVNRHIFGYEDIRQYDQLIELLIKVRAPKLSKDFRPTRVKEILNQSLQVLTDDDLSAMVSTMEQMDALEDTMQSYQAAIQAARMVRNEYNRYNQYILGKKGDAYLKALNRTRSLNLRVQDAQAQCASLQQQLDLQEERQRQSGERLDQARARRDALGEDTLSAKREQLRRERENCTALAERLKQGETQLQRLEDGINQREGKLRDLKTECDSIRSEVRRSLRELDDQNTLLLLEPEHSQYVRALQAERPDADQGPVLAALRQRSRQIGEVLNCLRQVEAAKSVYDSACQALDMAESAVREQEILTRNAQTQEREERDKLLEEFTRWRDRNVQLGIPQDTWLELQRALTGYRSPADWSLIRNQIDECTRKQESMLRRDQLKAEEALSTLAADQRELERRLRQIKDQPEPVPPRRDQIQATRLQLAMQGIPCAPFYELIDFAPGLPQASRDLLEAQLLDAGLLDALVVPEEHLPAVRELLAEYPDRFLLPGPAAAQPLEDIVLDHAGRFPKEAQACLRAISRSDLNAETALLPDGRFRCGMIRGRSHAGGPAGFVGAAARAANRQRQIEELEQQLEQLSEKVRNARAEAERLGRSLSQLEEERTRMPAAEDLDQALEMLEQTARDLRLAKEERERRLNDERAAKRELSAREETCRTRSAGLPYERDIPSYEEAGDAAALYRETLQELESSRQRLLFSVRSMEDQEETISEQRDQLTDRRRDNAKTREAMLTGQASADALQAFLDRPENRTRARLLAELEEEISRQDGENRDAEKQCTRLEEQLKNSDDQLRERKQRHLDAVLEEQDLERYFSEDLELGFSGLDSALGLEERAQQAASKIPPNDRERTPEHMGDALRSNLQRLNSSLLNYHPEIRLLFDAPGQPAHLRQRLCVILKKGGKELSLYDFIRSLQADIESTGAILEERDRELFEDILTETVSYKLRARIEESGRWTRDMTALMATLTTSMGLTFSLDWKEKKAEGDGELDTAHLVTLLNKDRALLTQEDSQKVSSHFRSRVKRAREEAHLQGDSVNYADLIRGVLDYRNWYEFRLFYRRGEDSKRELSDRAFNRFSGGEKAMAMYVPLFAAVSAQYLKGAASCPRLLALDEAFAGVDDQNISAMFELMGALEFDYIINSQVLWGCYASVADLDIAEMYHPANAPVVTILRYHWNGKRKTLEDDSP